MGVLLTPWSGQVMHPQTPRKTQMLKTIEKGVGACSLVYNIYGLGQVTSESIIHMEMHKPNNKLVNA
jgi:hypothetical protein